MPTSQPAAVTFFQHGSESLGALCDAIGFDGQSREAALALFRRLTGAWGETPIGSEPRWPSDITDDHTPYEFSIAVERHRPELRMLVEAQAPTADVVSQWRAGLALTEELERAAGAFLGRFRKIHELFYVEDPAARFGLWHAANVRVGVRPEFKVYLNPQARGQEQAAEVLEEALSRLGFRGAASSIPRSSSGYDEIKYFSLDLVDSDTARVKVYLSHHRTTAADIEASLSAASNYVAGESSEFCRSMAGHDGPYLNLALQTCYSFTTRGGNRPVAATLYFPVRAYVDSDDVACRRIIDYMMVEDRPLYERVLNAFARRGLDAGTGIQTFASYRRENFCRRVTVYLSPEAYGMAPRSLGYRAPVSGVRAAPNMREVPTPTPINAVIGKRR